MSMAEPEEKLHAALRTAADRLIAGTPLRSSGKLTITDLAAEAGIKRWLLTQSEKRELTDRVNTYAAITYELADQLAEAERQRDQTQAELERRQDTVTVLTDHRPQRESDMYQFVTM